MSLPSRRRTATSFTALLALYALAAPPAGAQALSISNSAPRSDAPATVHGLALYGEPELPAGFDHFPYVNPEAPKGGELTQAAVGGSFDSTNPFIIRGTPAAGVSRIYDTLLEGNPDEPFSLYGLLAQGIRLDPEREWIEFDLRPEARFHDGEPLTADDVVFSFELLTEQGNPFYGAYYADVESATALDEDTVRFTFASTHSRELPLIVGQLPILPEHYWASRDFTSPTLEAHPGSGPYRIAEVDPGRRIVYERVADYWGQDLAVNRGRHNIDRLVHDYYRDRDIAWEAFKAGVLDYRIDARAATWATGYDFPAVEAGRVKKLSIPDGQPARMQAFIFNLRQETFQDPRVREALALTFDFPWLNANIFYDAYRRTRSFFQNSEMAATGLPSEAELEILGPWRDQLPEDVFDEPLPMDHPQALRERLRLALTLLREAGFEVRDGGLTDAETGEPLTLEVLLYDSGLERVVQPMLRNMARLGIKGTIRIVDINQYLNRLRGFDFDMVVGQFPQSNNPGNEQREFWTSDYADVPQSRNLMGLADPVVDDLVEQLIRADSRETLHTLTRALDRVLRHRFIVIPHYHSGETRVAVWDKFGWPDPSPRYGRDLDAWWVDPERAARLEQGDPRS
ncbi:MAG: ABC transporter substrate-binding protein [Halomonas sp.]|uniref:extracellular solute-binding protein n=1 Tax=Halomonas sp. TaxID=1486246 RepID=UPI00179C7293|nr:extracellular solute-binding protein [Halomonas sp.]NWN82618.1 ABC transporter substrate-binding protein [Halomonas sp.]